MVKNDCLIQVHGLLMDIACEEWLFDLGAWIADEHCMMKNDCLIQVHELLMNIS